MKKVIELLEDALDVMLHVTQIPESYQEIAYIKEALAELKAPPRWETPEQWEKRTGKAWPEMAAVYAFPDLGWIAMSFWMPKLNTFLGDRSHDDIIIICATESGPPPKEWRPEE
jgi:hypothetical protein